ncbi:MAG: fumarylacetoacetase [Acidimicrobiia bacterium]|nr:fumarylacetoacetase [Acidimicrobiia bacterium]
MTISPELTSWVPVPLGSDFPIQNLPYGVFRDAAGTRCGVAIGDAVFDLGRAESAGLFHNTGLDHDTFRSDNLNGFLGHARGVWSMVRSRVTEVLSFDNAEGKAFCADHHLIIDHPVQMLVPVDIGDFVAFSSSEQHAMNVGKLLRPGSDPLPPNWKRLPVAHHGRAGTVVVSGSDIPRPYGQRSGDGAPTFGPTDKLDFAVEVGFITGHGLERGIDIPIGDAEHHIFGMVLVNDWSARDIQAWESAPLGPFLGTSFATTVSPWIVPLEALAPFRSVPPIQDPPPFPYLINPERRGFDIGLSASITPAGSIEPTTVTEVSFGTMYWTIDQQLAHATVNGASVRAGDLFASGTVSGTEDTSFGSLLELTANGSKPLSMAGGSHRTFLVDGDTVTLAGRCEAEGRVTIGFGECTGTVRA